jgi:MFS superfamily sulfate permease-like transporter
VSITLITSVRIHVNERFKKQMKGIPIPTELLVIIIGTIVTHLFKLDKTHELSVVGNIPIGLPVPKLPDFGLVFDILPDAIIIALVSYSTSISSAEIYAKKHNYKINPNQVASLLGLKVFNKV